MENSTKQIIQNLYIIVKDGAVIEVSDALLQTTGYSSDELVHKDLNSIWSEILRININFNEISAKHAGFLFTKSREARDIFIHKVVEEQSKSTKYVFIDNPKSRLYQEFPFVDYLYSKGNSGVAIFSVPDMTLIKANQAYLDFLDAPYNNKFISIGRPNTSIVKGYAGSSFERMINHIFQTGEVLDIKAEPYSGLTRGITYWDTTIVPIYQDEIMKYIIQISHDVTEEVNNKKLSEEQNRMIIEQNKQLEAIIENMYDALVISDRNGNLLKVNAEAKRLFYHIENTSILGETLKTNSYIDMDGNEKTYEKMPAARALKGEKVKHDRIRLVSPERDIVFEASATPVYDEMNQIIMTVTCCRDVTELVSKENEIRQQKDLLETILSNAYENIFVIDANGSYIYHKNNIIKEISENYSNLDEAFRAVKYYDTEGNDIPLERSFAYRVKNGETIKDEIVIIQAAGEEYYLLCSGTPFYDKDGRFLYGIGTSRDITEIIKSQNALRETQEKLLIAEREKSLALETSIKFKDEFIYLISHEFRTPSAVINSALQAIQLICKEDVTERMNKYLNTIKMNTNRQLRLVNNLLDVTRISTGHIRINNSTFDIVYVTRSIVKSVELYANQKGVNLHFESTISKKLVYLDEEKYERIMLNLLANALKFTPKGKNITVSMNTRKRRNKNLVSISIKDEGIGIPKDRQQVIFERFGQADTSLSRQAEGTGLGLYLVKRFIDVFDGEIFLESEEGKGSIFTVMLPILNSKAIHETAAYVETKTKFLDSDNRIVNSASIEFSDIYFD